MPLRQPPSPASPAVCPCRDPPAKVVHADHQRPYSSQCAHSGPLLPALAPTATCGLETDVSANATHPEVNLRIYSQLIIDRGAKNSTGKRQSLKKMRLKKLGFLHSRVLNPCLKTLTQIKLKWMKDLNVRTKTIKLLSEHMGRKHLTWVFAMI